MPFDVTIDTLDGQYNWFDLPEENRPEIQRAREEFNSMQFDPDKYLRIEGPNSLFDERWGRITGIRIDG